jgi:hypothetical protein
VRYQTTDASSVAEIGALLLGCDLTTESCRTAMYAIGGSAQNNGINRLTASTGSDQYLIGVVTLTATPRP